MKNILNQMPNYIKASRRFFLLVLLGGGIKLSLGWLLKFEKRYQASNFKNPKMKAGYGFGSGSYGFDSYGT